MDVKINDTTFPVPFSLPLISLSDCISYYEKYGKNLDNELLEIESKDLDAGDLNIELRKWQDKKAIAWYSFWTGFDFFDAENEKFSEPIKEQYRQLQPLLHNEEDIIQNFGEEFIWNGEPWVINDFKKGSWDEMDFNEQQIFKKVFLNLELVKKNNWEAMIFICVLFCRRKDEKIKDVLIYNNLPATDIKSLSPPTLNPDRKELMKSLPMNYVMSIYSLINVTNEPQRIFHGLYNSKQLIEL